ncbi:MAG: DUF883 family protein [Azonexus sp.]|jgi:ElaB/YqjD/DUF883 family membrane-anchored ribosome-binding protein|nr:DUF883 family protein [Betaproteobacteria bacterium]MBK8918680.1 DUF883 family protein [Betaproteobacteria bacterium]MBP6034613.1 DUF883 family protein [Azonexus sp.]MBP6905153.1 DUF883 family protein [Azonexus sp.]
MSTELTTTPGAAGLTQDDPGKEFKTIAANGEALLKDAAHATADRLAAARRKLERQLAAAKAGLGSAGTAVGAKAKSIACSTDGYVRDNPWKTVGLAAVAGVLVGIVLIRR